MQTCCETLCLSYLLTMHKVIEGSHILICDVDKFNKELLKFLITNVYGIRLYVSLERIRDNIEAELKWPYDEHIDMKQVIEEWVYTSKYPSVITTSMSYESCIELIKDIQPEIIAYSWMRKQSNVQCPF